MLQGRIFNIYDFVMIIDCKYKLNNKNKEIKLKFTPVCIIHDIGM